MSRAAYMRKYRAKRKAQLQPLTGDPATDLVHALRDGINAERDILHAEARIRDLEDEVARLKRNLATRPSVIEAADPSFQRFRPAPKPRKK